MSWTAAAGVAGVSHGQAAHAGLPYSAYNPALSGDGRRVAFETSAGNLNFAKRYGDTSIALADLEGGRARLVGSAPGGTDRTAYAPAISGDGRVVAFQAVDASRADPRRVRPTRVLVRAADGSTTAVRRTPAYEPALSADGRVVAFVAPGPEGSSRVFVFDRASRRTILVSRATGPAGAPADGDSWGPRLSADGQRVAFATTARNLGDRPPEPGEARVLVRDVRRGTTRLVSTGVDGAPLPGFASEPAISADGRIVAFSLAPPGALRGATRRTPRPARPRAQPRRRSGAPARAVTWLCRSAGDRRGRLARGLHRGQRRAVPAGPAGRGLRWDHASPPPPDVRAARGRSHRRGALPTRTTRVVRRRPRLSVTADSAPAPPRRCPRSSAARPRSGRGDR